jgi:hypothetical protein
LNALPDRCPSCNVRLKGSLRIGVLLNDLSPRQMCVQGAVRNCVLNLKQMETSSDLTIFKLLP